MEFRQLITFCKAAEFESFTKAADALFLTQAAVSQQIKSLEQELGARLFERGARGISLTESGRKLHGHATDIIRCCQEMKEAVGGAAREITGEVRLAASTIPGEHLLPERLSRFRTQFPQVRVTMVISDSERTIEEVSANRADMAVVGLRPRSEKLQCDVFELDRLVIVVPRNHPWTRRRKPVTLAELVEEPFVLRAPGSGTRQCLAEALEAADLSLANMNTTLELGSNESVVTAVLQGAGIATVSQLAAARELTSGKLKTAQIEGLNLERKFYLVTKRGRLLSPAAKTLMDALPAPQ